MSDATHPSSDPRPRPQYGEYATPEEQQARIRQPAASAALEAGIAPAEVAAPAAAVAAGPAAAPAARGPLVDRIITIGLLAYGLVQVLTTIPSAIEYAGLVDVWMQALQLSGEFTNYGEGRLYGAIAAGVLGVGYVVTALLSVMQLRRGKLAFWIALVGGIVFSLIAGILLAVPLMNDPAVLDGLLSLSGTSAG